MKGQKQRIITILMVLTLVFSSVFLINTSVFAEGDENKENLFDQLIEKIENAKDGEEINLESGNYIFTKTINLVNKDIKLNSNGEAVFKRDSKFNKQFFVIDKESKLDLGSGLTIDGENRISTNIVGFIENRGKLFLNGVIIQNDKAESSTYFAAPIKSIGEGSYIEMNSGAIKNNDYSGRHVSYSAGAIYLDSGSEMVMNGGTIFGNKASVYSTSNNNVPIGSDSPGVGGIMVAPGSKFTMNGGTISENQGWGGGVLVGTANPYLYNRNATEESELQSQELSTAIFNGGTIEKNLAVAGGGISGNGNVDIRLPEDSEIEIKENRARQGGGIFISDWAVDGIGTSKEIAQLPLETWKKHYKGGLYMANGKILNNYSDGIGGGVLVASDGSYLIGGLIDGNYARDYGGGIGGSTVPYTIRIENAFVSENLADGTVTTIHEDGIYLPANSGGGVWFCPTGNGIFHAENGATFIKNTAKEAGDELWSSSKISDSDYSVTLSNRLANGEKVTYYKDTLNNRYQEPGIEVNVHDVSDELAVKGIAEDKNIEISRQLSKLIITNNQASKGGGIGSNANVIFGKKPEVENPLKDIEIIKKWDPELEPKEVEVELRAKIGELDWLIEKFVLNESNEFKHIVKDLPATVNDHKIEDIVYVKELDSAEFKVEVSEIKLEETSDTEARQRFTIELYNKKRVPWTPLEPAKTKLTVNKKWEGVDSNDMPEIKVFLVKNDEKTDEFLILNKENNWSGEFKDLPHTDTIESPINKYSVIEEGEVGGIIRINNREFKVIYDKGNITNELIIPKTSIKISKVWEKDKEADRPKEIKVHLFANEEEIKVLTITPDENGNWEASVEDLPIYKDGEKIIYTVVEEKVKGYSASYRGDSEKGFVIINTKDTPPVETPPEKKIPKTGDAQNNLIYVSIILVSTIGYYIIKNRRTKLV